MFGHYADPVSARRWAATAMGREEACNVRSIGMPRLNELSGIWPPMCLS